MSTFLRSSVAMTTIAVKTAAHVAFLPMTVPLHIASSTSGMLIGTCTHVIGSVFSVADRALRPTVGKTTSSENPIEGLIRNVTSIIPFVFHAVDRIKDDIGSTILGVVSPVLAGDSQQRADTRNHRSQELASVSTVDQDEEFLERLRLDYPPSPSKNIKEFSKSSKEFYSSGEELQQSPRSADVSKFLLRVCDLGISLRSKADQHEKIFHIDLSKEFANNELTMQAVDALVEKGLALLSSCPEAQLRNTTSSHDLVDWKPEASTAKLLRKKLKLTPDNWTALMTKEVLVWSGKLRDKDVHKADVPVFLSRGIVPACPRGMLNLFWDDSRTRSYNKFSLGRTTSMEIEEGLDPSSTSVRATKVVQSETQVPFTGFSVVMSTLMHARQIDEPEVCYVIVSRSLSPGRAGPHVGSRSSSVEASKNELLWGVNILRRVPGNPNLTDLTSISQVSSAMVVQFLTHRVGIMAVESCYNAMRGV